MKGYTFPPLLLFLGASRVLGSGAPNFRGFRESDLQSTFENVISEVKGGIDLSRHAFDDAISGELFTDDEPDLALGGHHEANQTIYQIIKANEHTTKFATLVDKYESLVKFLNSSSASNATLFVPIDSAFAKIPNDDAKKPSKKFIKALLQYHVAIDEYRAHDLIGVHTLPSLFREEWLGGQPQRLRVRLGLMGIRVNFYSKVVAANRDATNGVIHFVNQVLVPPPMVGRELSLFPSAFSTLLHAYDKTDFVDYIHHVQMNGSTVFAPSNSAFARLGTAANAFLFNTPKGLKCLKALLKYQIVANSTLYSDAMYDNDDDGDAAVHGEEVDRVHYDLETLLDKMPIEVDITRWHGLITTMTVNKHVRVNVQDGIAKNGVIHVVDKVPIPPHKGHKSEIDQLDDGEVSAEELEARLSPFIGEEDEFEVGEL